MHLAEPSGRDDLPLVDPCAGHAEARAVGEREFEEVTPRMGIGNDGRIEAQRDDAGPVDLHGLAVDLQLDGLVAHAEEAAGHAVAVDQPDDLGGSGLALDPVPELIEGVGIGRRGQHHAEHGIDRDGQLAQSRVPFDLDRVFRRGADDHPHQPVAVGKQYVRALGRSVRGSRFAEQLHERANRQVLA